MTDLEASPPQTSRASLGSLSLLSGIVLLTLRGMDLIRQLPGMPTFWYEHAPLWWGIGFIAVAFGVWSLGRVAIETHARSWQPQRSGRRFHSLILYTRAQCHLCEEAREILEAHRSWLPEIVEVDVDTDPRLVEQFTTCVPVVSLDGKVRFRGRISTVLLRRLINATAPNYVSKS